jgi:subtilisin family serine protease
MSKLYTGLTAIAVLLLTCSGAAGAIVEFKDPLSSDQYYLGMMNFPEAWAQIRDLDRVGDITVAVADTGFEGKHLDLDRGQLVTGINIVNGKRYDLAPQHPHGMGTIGPIGALSGNDEGISRAAWQAKVMPIKVSTRSDGAAYLAHLASAIRYAADHGARVISISYGGVDTQTLENAARYAHQRGAVVFMSAGNDGRQQNTWPNQ